MMCLYGSSYDQETGTLHVGTITSKVHETEIYIQPTRCRIRTYSGTNTVAVDIHEKRSRITMRLDSSLRSTIQMHLSTPDRLNIHTGYSTLYHYHHGVTVQIHQ